MKKMIYITNIPTPYRNYRFNQMAKYFAEQGIDVEVLYMNASEPDRNWELDYSEMQHKYQIFSHNQVTKKLGMWMHFSPMLQKYLLTQKYDIAVLGGLASPAHFIASILLKKNKINILSVESNIASIGNKGSFATRVKNYLMARFSYFQVTGERSIEFIRHYVPTVTKNNIITLPNVINETLFETTSPEEVDEVIRDKIEEQKKLGNKVVCIPARLIEDKGLIPFLSAVESTDKMAIFIAGDGPLKDMLTDIIQTRGLNVHLLGALPPSQIVGMMKMADFLALPSKSDPSPLSVIEAISVGLPLLISKNVGNYEDVLRESENGWGFEFNNFDETRRAIKSVIEVNETAYESMRERARQLFVQNFSTDKVLKRYHDELTALRQG